MIDRMTAATYFTGWWVVRTLPEAVAYKFFSGIADFVFRRNGKSVQRLRMNLSRTQPSPRDIGAREPHPGSDAVLYALLV